MYHSTFFLRFSKVPVCLFCAAIYPFATVLAAPAKPLPFKCERLNPGGLVFCPPITGYTCRVAHPRTGGEVSLPGECPPNANKKACAQLEAECKKLLPENPICDVVAHDADPGDECYQLDEIESCTIECVTYRDSSGRLRHKYLGEAICGVSCELVKASDTDDPTPPPE